MGTVCSIHKTGGADALRSQVHVTVNPLAPLHKPVRVAAVQRDVLIRRMQDPMGDPVPLEEQRDGCMCVCVQLLMDSKGLGDQIPDSKFGAILIPSETAWLAVGWRA